MVKETGLRSVDASRMGSNPIPSKEFPSSPKNRVVIIYDPFAVLVKQYFIRYGVKVSIRLFHRRNPSSILGIGTNTHNSVVECYTSNVDTRVRFPLSVK